MKEQLHLSKHHGAGNDFLVIVDPFRHWPLHKELARALCDRRSGVGADGIMRATLDVESGNPVMELRNADGSPAEMSGNGMRCFAQAVLNRGMAPSTAFTVGTDAGDRFVRVTLNPDISSVLVGVEMGSPVVEEEPFRIQAGEHSWQATKVSVGNPHLVVVLGDLKELDSLELDVVGPQLEAEHGANVEWVVPLQGGDLALRVWERGAGETRACGTGSVAALCVAAKLGICNAQASVHNPGGLLEVDVSSSQAVLRGEAILVAQVIVDEHWLDKIEVEPPA